MRMIRFLMVGLCGLTLAASPAWAAAIQGDYLETRSADIYTGPCVANAEVGLVGDQAIVAWRIREGAWNGVKLDGLSVVGVAKASNTLGDPFHDPYPAKSVLIVDSKATAEQRVALQQFAQFMAQDLLKNIVKVEEAAIQLDMGSEHGVARLVAGNLAKIETRCLSEKDHLCGNEEVYYDPLTEVSHAMPAYAETDEFSGSGLGVNWKVHGKRSAFVGSFSQVPLVSMN
ncbi:MAG: DUF1326 domain-containing protein [Acidobacteriota bacterium]